MDKTFYLGPEFNNYCNKFQNAATHLGNISGRWLGVRTFLCGVVIVFATQSFPLFAFNIMDEFYNLTDFWQISLSIAWGLKTIGFMSKLCKQIATLSVSLITLEKCYDWIDHDNVENEVGLKKFLRDDRWVAIDVKNVSCLSEDKKTLALDHVDIEIKSNMKVALMGDANSGKTHIRNVALGLQEMRTSSKERGSLRIFGQSITELNLFNVRQRTVSLFKEGKLFSGTVKDNIDPENIISDSLIVKTLYWLKIFEVLDSHQKVLKRSNTPKLINNDTDGSKSQSKSKDTQPNQKQFLFFKEFINSHAVPNSEERDILKNYLRSKVEADGANFEESQRKIILICRTLLKQPDILFWDELSCDIPDLEDKYYVDALFCHLNNTAIVAVLHNFDYVNKFDYIYWFKDGKVIEQGTPNALLEDDDSLLSKSFRKNNKKLYRFILQALGIDKGDKDIASKLRKRDKDEPKDPNLEK